MAIIGEKRSGSAIKVTPDLFIHNLHTVFLGAAETDENMIDEEV